jgi:hypothetical protein
MPQWARSRLRGLHGPTLLLTERQNVLGGVVVSMKARSTRWAGMPADRQAFGDQHAEQQDDVVRRIVLPDPNTPGAYGIPLCVILPLAFLSHSCDSRAQLSRCASHPLLLGGLALAIRQRRLRT